MPNYMSSLWLIGFVCVFKRRDVIKSQKQQFNQTFNWRYSRAVTAAAISCSFVSCVPSLQACRWDLYWCLLTHTGLHCVSITILWTFQVGFSSLYDIFTVLNESKKAAGHWSPSKSAQHPLFSHSPTAKTIWIPDYVSVFSRAGWRSGTVWGGGRTSGDVLLQSVLHCTLDSWPSHINQICRSSHMSKQRDKPRLLPGTLRMHCQHSVHVSTLHASFLQRHSSKDDETSCLKWISEGLLISSEFLLQEALG